MQQAIGHYFPETRALYRFTHRDPDVLFPRRCIDLLHKSIQRTSLRCIFRSDVYQNPSGFRDLRLTTEEKVWMTRTCPYFSAEYLEYLSEFRFDPAQISIKFIPVSGDGEEGRVEIEADGLWREAILWEVPVMACLSELYFRLGVTDWSYEGQKGKPRTLYSCSRVQLVPQRMHRRKLEHCCKQDVPSANSGLGEDDHSTPRTSSSQL